MTRGAPLPPLPCPAPHTPGAHRRRWRVAARESVGSGRAAQTSRGHECRGAVGGITRGGEGSTGARRPAPPRPDRFAPPRPDRFAPPRSGLCVGRPSTLQLTPTRGYPKFQNGTLILELMDAN